MKSNSLTRLYSSSFVLAMMGQRLLATDVSGTIVNQTWTSNNSPYRVVGDILVAGLTINPGVTVLFASNYVFEVAGVLKANGTTTAPIVFTRTNGGWQGIYFNYSSPGSVLAYCTISKSTNSGIRIFNSNPAIKNCFITSNSSVYGAGINASIASGNLSITDTVIANNSANIDPALIDPTINPYHNSLGGGIYAVMSTSSLLMSGCIVTNNRANANFDYGWASGGGVYVNGNASLKWCVISGNSCEGRTEPFVTGGNARGAGVFANGGLITLNNCIIKSNTAWCPESGHAAGEAYGGALYLNSGSVDMANCIVQGNVASAFYATGGGGICLGGGYIGGGGTLNIVNSTIAYQNSEGLAIAGGSSATLLNSIVYFNASGGAQIAGVNGSMGTANLAYSDVQGGFTGTGNINANPIFLSTSDLIIVPGSPCINKGSTNAAYNDAFFPPSLGSARNDMGAHGGPGAGARMRIEAQPQIKVALLGGVPGYTYLIQASTNLLDWQTVQENQIAHVGDVSYFHEPNMNTLPYRFYKLNLAP